MEVYEQDSSEQQACINWKILSRNPTHINYLSYVTLNITVTVTRITVS